MPDLVTHLAAGFLASRFFRLGRFLVLFYLGALLPDLLSRPFHIPFPPIFPATQPFHAPLVLFAFCWLAALFFRAEARRGVFAALYAGCLSHLLLDLLQTHLIGGYIWLFPFSTRTYSLGFAEPEYFLDYLWLTLPLSLLAFSLAWPGRERKG